MKIKKLGNNILLLLANSQYELTSTFIRIQEFYESPYKNIQGKFFTLEDFMDTYAKNMGNFTYFTDWSGFNIPGNVVNNFFDIFLKDVDGLSKKEWILLELIKSKYNIIKDDYYVIGCVNDCDGNIIKHEIAHALFYLDEDYKKEMSTLSKVYKNKNKACEKSLLEMGYNRKFLLDEIQAYHIESDKQFENIFNKYLKKHKLKI